MPKKSKVKNVAPKVYKGVAYKSSLEAYCAKKLEENGLPNHYESWKVILYPKLESNVVSFEPRTKKEKGFTTKQRTFSPAPTKLRQAIYTPDFPCLDQGWVIETKGLRTEAFNGRWRAFKHWLATNNLEHFRLYMPGNQGEVDQCIAHILSTNS